MALSHNGLVKLVEECGELAQIAAKKIAYPHVDFHPDGQFMPDRLAEEIADVMAAATTVVDMLDLDWSAINARVDRKKRMFQQWARE